MKGSKFFSFVEDTKYTSLEGRKRGRIKGRGERGDGRGRERERTNRSAIYGRAGCMWTRRCTKFKVMDKEVKDVIKGGLAVWAVRKANSLVIHYCQIEDQLSLGFRRVKVNPFMY